jgi:hypothetical protein
MFPFKDFLQRYTICLTIWGLVSFSLGLLQAAIQHRTDSFGLSGFAIYSVCVGTVQGLLTLLVLHWFAELVWRIRVRIVRFAAAWFIASLAGIIVLVGLFLGMYPLGYISYQLTGNNLHDAATFIWNVVLSTMFIWITTALLAGGVIGSILSRDHRS